MFLVYLGHSCFYPKNYYMTLLDVAILVLISYLGYRGFRKGFIYAAGTFLGVVFSIFVALRYYAPVADWLIAVTGWGASLRFLVLIAAFILVNRLVTLLFLLLTKVIRIATWLPLVGPADKLVGLLFGVLEGFVLAAVFVFALERLVFLPIVVNALGNSSLVPLLQEFSQLLWPLYPEALRILRSSVDFTESRFGHIR